jgi:ribosomal protein S18 acetylase RimI-like enzyme
MEPVDVSAGRSAVRIRRAAEQDVPAIVALLTDDAIGAGRERGDDLAPYRRAFAAVDADPAHLLVVAEVDGATAGTLQLSFLPGLSRQGALRAQVEGVRVGAAHRGSGLGTVLLRWEEGELQPGRRAPAADDGPAARGRAPLLRAPRLRRLAPRDEARPRRLTSSV